MSVPPGNPTDADFSDSNPSQRSSRRVALLLCGVALAAAAAGGLLFTRFAAHAHTDPGLSYRDPTTLTKVLKRARDAEASGDRSSAIAAYRFVEAVGAGGQPELEPYMTAARAGLQRLGEEPRR